MSKLGYYGLAAVTVLIALVWGKGWIKIALLAFAAWNGYKGYTATS
jgi:hypothetical protein